MRKILITGDFVYSRDIQERDYFISEEYKNIIKQHDIFCCNLEGPVITEECNKIKKIGPNIENNKSAVKKIKEEGCNLFCLANNHIFDYGLEGLKSTVGYLDKEGIAHIGAGINKEQIEATYYKDFGDMRVNFLNIAENGFGASIGLDFGYKYAFDYNVKDKLNKCKQDSDFVIVISHMGAEHWKIPLPEVREFYKLLIEWGADAVIAHHPHVPQGWEEYKNKIIFYSLGNFIFDKGRGIQNPKAYSVSLRLKKGCKIKYDIIPTYFDEYTLKVDSASYNSLADILHNEELYNKILNENIDKLYRGYKKSYYKVTCNDRGSFKERIKGFIKRNILRRKFSDIWLYHNLNIETHLWICKRATRTIIERKFKEDIRK